MGKNGTVGDFSKWNIIKDYKKAAEALDGVILRIGYRASASGKLTEDPKFELHLNEFIKRVPVGVYFFTTAITSKEAEEEAKWVIDTLKKYRVANKMRFPIAIDTEWCNKDHNGRSDSLSNDKRTECVVAFCKALESAGYDTMIYASDDWFVSQLDYNKVKEYKKWVARYSSSKPVKAKDNVIGWQKTDNFKCPGIDKGIDMSEWYVDLDTKPTATTVKTESAKEESKPAKPSVVSGRKVTLKDEPLYNSSTAKTSVRFISGDYYYWSDDVLNGKVRITSDSKYVGALAKVTGWINAPK